MSSVSKVIVDQKESNSLLYLPLDKIIQQSNTAKTSGLDLSKASNESNANVSASDVINSITDRSRSALRARERGGR